LLELGLAIWQAQLLYVFSLHCSNFVLTERVVTCGVVW